MIDQRIPRGISKMMPILICFGLLMLLGVWIIYDISRKDYDQNVIRREELRQNALHAQPQIQTPPVAVTAPAPIIAATPIAPVFTCRRATKAIEIDGNVAGEEWAEAEFIGHFMHLKDATPATSRTEARLLWDDQYLYFCAVMDDADVYALRERHNDMTWYDDVFELFFKPDAGKLAYYELQVNARNTTMEMFLPSRGSGGYGRWIGRHPFHLESKVVLRPGSTLNNYADRDVGWVVEGRIPWTDFSPTGGKPEPGAEWKFALCRYDYSVAYDREDLSSCAPLKDGFHNYENYATLRFAK